MFAPLATPGPINPDFKWMTPFLGEWRLFIGGIWGLCLIGAMVFLIRGIVFMAKGRGKNQSKYDHGHTLVVRAATGMMLLAAAPIFGLITTFRI